MKRNGSIAEDKGQISIDFLAGMLIFIITVLFVLQFMTGIVVPFTATSEETIAMSQRAASELYSDRFTLPGMDKGNLSESEINDYFNNNDIDAMKTDLGIPEQYGLNITITGTAGNILSGTTQWSEGSSPPNVGSVSTQTRIAYVEGKDTVIIKVRVWSGT